MKAKIGKKDLENSDKNTMLQCSICHGDIEHKSLDGKVYWTEGHNADHILINPRTDKGPCFFEEGHYRCCDWCNVNLVIPVRIKQMNDRSDLETK